MQFTFQVIRVVVVGVLLFIAIKYAIANSIPFLNFHFILLQLGQLTEITTTTPQVQEEKEN